MRSLIVKISIFSFSLFVLPVFADPHIASQYQIIYQIPLAWKLANQQQDPQGYTFQYQPTKINELSFESITVNYGKGIQIPLKDSMQQVISEMNTTDCKRRESTVLKQEDKTLVFSTLLDQCANGKSLTQIFKVFNMPDGQYSIVYSADTHAEMRIKQMESVIETAKLLPTQHS